MGRSAAPPIPDQAGVILDFCGLMVQWEWECTVFLIWYVYLDIRHTISFTFDFYIPRCANGRTPRTEDPYSYVYGMNTYTM